MDDFKRVFASIIASFGRFWSTIAHRMRANRRIGIIGIGIVGILIVLCIALIARSARSVPSDWMGSQISGGSAGNPGIPQEELFLPEEPDFIPGFIPNREQRSVWTSADAEPYWIDPLVDGSEKYVTIIETTINTLLERVP